MTASGGAGPTGNAEEARRQAESGAKQAEEHLHRGAEQAEEHLHRGAERARETAEDLGAEAKRAATDVLGEARDKVHSVLDQQKRHAADEIADVAHALRTGAGDLEAHDKAYIARHVDSVAVGIDRVADNLRQQDFGALLGQVQDFAKRQPGLFIGGMFATGFALARFVKSSAERHESGAVHQPPGPGPRTASPGDGPQQWGPHASSPGAGPEQWGQPGAQPGTRPQQSE